ncbi:MAG: Rid family detoxifying hydrolase [Atopobiaceae bacterium]|jgi:2-iminobutanoate/2-iminopropanoate deaminase|nr:Rid family detoxifying hydrolase [Atopobiaceae bacterium]MCI2173219.1 Rid family detoxifying hydrolase [Atopobiaceae bacterium]MCI2207214.1 Rid family detoxifying hydrolase [Atopobiaceae bacterium]
MKYPINSTGAPAAIGPYSQGTTAARFVFVSGQIAVDPTTGKMVEGGVGAQTSRCITNMEAVLTELDLTLEDVTKTTVFLTSMDDFEQMNEVYGEHFSAPEPARTTVAVAALPKGAIVEIECIACR